MGVENKFKSSKMRFRQRKWFWPALYSFLAVMLVGLVIGYYAITADSDQLEDPTKLTQEVGGNEESVIPVSTQGESMKYPIKEALIPETQILQEFYDVNATADLQQKALLVFNQTYSTSQGISISVKGEPFEVLTAMSGVVKEVKMDAFTGNKIKIEHANGYTTVYSSVADILVEEGDEVKQGDQIATSIENEWNPYAGVHLHFQVLKDGVLINPKTLLAF